MVIQPGRGYADLVMVRPQQDLETDEPTHFSDVVAELLRPPYVWWLLIAMVLQAYTPLYVAPVAAAIAAMGVIFARQSVRARRPVPVAERTD
jgi:hypothetical protein